MTSLRVFPALALSIAVGFVLTGCESGNGNTLNTGAKVNESSSGEIPGPQTEPPLTEASDSENSTETNPTANTSLVVPVVDRAGFDAVLAKHKGKVVLVDFWATWCGPCRKKFPHTVALAKELKAEGLSVVSVSLDDEDNHEAVVKFLTEQQAQFDNLRSQLGASDESFMAFEIPALALPYLRLYGRDGQVVRTFGFDPNSDKQFTDEDVADATKTALKMKAE